MNLGKIGSFSVAQFKNVYVNKTDSFGVEHIPKEIRKFIGNILQILYFKETTKFILQIFLE